MVVTIRMNKPIPPYTGSDRQQKQTRDVTKKELHHQAMRLKAAKRKSSHLKKQRNEEKAKRIEAERTLAQERSNTATRELKLRIQTKLDDRAFYNDRRQGKEEGPR